MRPVAVELKVLRRKAIDVVDGRADDAQPRERARRVLELAPERLDVVGVHVRVAERVHKVARRQVTDLREHAREQRVRRDVEGHPQADVRRALVELARELAVGDVELMIDWRLVVVAVIDD